MLTAVALGTGSDPVLWQVVAGPFLAASALLVLAGAPKVLDPQPLLRALRSVGVAGPTVRGRLLSGGVVRVLAVVESSAGVAGLLAPSRVTAVLVVAAYVVFSGFLVLALRRGGVVTSCGCFGKADTPATRTHLALTVLLALAALAVLLAPPAGPVWTSATSTATTLVLLGQAALLTYLAYVVMAVLPLVTSRAVRSASTVVRAAPRRHEAGA